MKPLPPNREPMPPSNESMKHCAAHGLIIRPLPGDAIALCPPLIGTENQIGDRFDSLARALDDTLDEPTRQGATAA